MMSILIIQILLTVLFVEWMLIGRVEIMNVNSVVGVVRQMTNNKILS